MTQLHERYEPRVCKVSDLSNAEKEKCMQIIVDGDGAEPDSVKEEFPKSPVVVVIYCDSEIVAVGAVKEKGTAIRQTYYKSVSTKSGVPVAPDSSEIGYIARVEEEKHSGQHFAEYIVEELVKVQPTPLISTTSHVAVKKALTKNGFVERGRSWDGKKKKDKEGKEIDNTLTLWLKEK